MPEFDLENLTALLAVATFAVAVFGAISACASLRLARNAERDSRLARRPRLCVEWRGIRAIGQAAVHVYGILRETSNLPTVVRRIEARADIIGGPTLDLEVSTPGSSVVPVLRGGELFTRFGVMFDAASEPGNAPLAILTVDVAVSVDEVRETWRYVLDVGDGGGAVSVSVLEVVLVPDRLSGHREADRMAEVLQCAWRGGLGPRRPPATSRPAPSQD